MWDTKLSKYSNNVPGNCEKNIDIYLEPVIKIHRVSFLYSYVRY